MAAFILLCQSLPVLGSTVEWRFRISTSSAAAFICITALNPEQMIDLYSKIRTLEIETITFLVTCDCWLVSRSVSSGGWSVQLVYPSIQGYNIVADEWVGAYNRLPLPHTVAGTTASRTATETSTKGSCY